MEGCGPQLHDSLFQSSLAASFLPSSLAALKVSSNDDLLALTMVLIGLWFVHIHIGVGRRMCGWDQLRVLSVKIFHTTVKALLDS